CRNRSTDSPVNATGIPKVEQVLELVGRRFSDHRLSLASAASECGGPLWLTARIVKRATGFNFSDHLHPLPIAAAARLLRESTLGIKEIAARVGYGSSSRLGIHFKRLCGETPVIYRASTSSTRVTARRDGLPI